MENKHPHKLKSGSRGINGTNIFKTIQAELNTTQVGVQYPGALIIFIQNILYFCRTKFYWAWGPWQLLASLAMLRTCGISMSDLVITWRYRKMDVMSLLKKSQTGKHSFLMV